jgi:hypothetical protein
MGTFTRQALKKEKVEEHSSSTNGWIILRNQPFSEIVKDRERSHKVTFNIQNKQIISSRYTGQFSREDDIGKILKIIRLTSHFEFEIARNTIIIK